MTENQIKSNHRICTAVFTHSIFRWQALERGETGHLMPVFNAKERVKKGELKVEDIPYMQRGGNWDNSDVKGAKKAKWLPSDK